MENEEKKINVKQRISKKYQDWGTKKFVFVIVMAYMLLMVILYIVTPINFIQRTKISIVKASTYILISVGLTMTSRVRKFSNFAQAEFVTFGLYVALATNMGNYKYLGIIFGNTIFGQMLAAFLLTGIVAMLGELLIFGPLIRRKATRLSLMTASIGFGIIIRQTLQELFSAKLQSNIPLYPDYFNTIGESSLVDIPVIGKLLGIPFVGLTRFTFLGKTAVIISQNDFWAVTVMLLTVYSLNFIFTRTTLGISMRATSDDDELAQITGINTSKINYATWFIAGGVTGMGALFRFSETAFQPASGFVLLLIIFAVVTLGGFDSFEGTLVAGFLVALVESYTSIANAFIFVKLNKTNAFFDFMIFWSPEKDWTQVIPFVIIIVVLIFRPRGLMGLVDPKSKL